MRAWNVVGKYPIYTDGKITHTEITLATLSGSYGTFTERVIGDQTGKTNDELIELARDAYFKTEYRAARSRLKVEYQARREEQERKAQSENYKAIRSSVSLDSVDKHNIDEEAAALARRDLSANRIAASDLGATIEKYAAELTEKAKDSKASSALFNAMLRGQL